MKNTFWLRRFAPISFHAAAVLYTGGTIAQLLKLTIDFSWTDMPFLIDWIIVGLGSIAVTGLIGFHRVILYRGVWEKVIHWLIVVHLIASIALHIYTIIVANHQLYASFPRSYSYFALVYFGLFAWRSWRIKLAADAI